MLDLGLGFGSGHQELNTEAVFGKIEYELTDIWALTVGGRYTLLDLHYSAKQSDGEFSGKVALNYYYNNDQMYYGSIARGFKGAGNVLAAYTWPLADAGELTLLLDSSYQSEVFYSNGTITIPGDPSSYDRNEEIGQDAYSLWNAHLAWVDAKGQMEVALWGKNLSDKEYATYMFELTDLIGADQVMRGVPLTYGIDVNYTF